MRPKKAMRALAASKHLISSDVVVSSQTSTSKMKTKSNLTKCCIMAALLLKGKTTELHKANAFFKLMKKKIVYDDMERFIPDMKTKQTIDFLGGDKVIREGTLISGSCVEIPCLAVGVFEGENVSFTFVRTLNTVVCFRARAERAAMATTRLQIKDFLFSLQKQKGALHIMELQ